MADDDLAKDAVRLWEELESDRGTWLTHWQQCANYIWPNRNDFIVTRAPGQKRMQYVFDATPIWALEQFAAGMHSMLTSPYLPWFSLWTEDDRLNAIGRVREWLQAAGDALYRLFNSARHNFASQSNELYLDLGLIGSATMAVLDGPYDNILFSTRHMKECVWAEGEDDRVDTVVRNFKLSARKAVALWGAKVGEKVGKAYVEKPETPFDFIHVVRPRRGRDPGRPADRRNKRWQAVYVGLDDKHVIEESGFDEFPYLCPRFSKVSGETYGRGQGMIALPDAKMLMSMVKTVLKAAEKIVDPPLMLPDDGFVMPIKTTPGSLNYFRAGMKPTDRIQPIETKGNVPIGIELLNALRQQLIRVFYVEWMIMPSDLKDPASSGKDVTATYVLQQRDEKMRLLSPVLARMQAEFLGPLIDRVFAMLWRRSLARRFGPGSPFPPPPPELSGVPLRVEYVSSIAIAQKTSQLDAVGRLIQQQLMLRQVDPQAPMVLDSEAIMRLTGRDLNAPAAALRSPEEMAQEAQQRAEAEASMNGAQNAAVAAGAFKDAGQGVKHLADAAGAGQDLQEAA